MQKLQSPRTIVIEKSVALEASISSLLGMLLSIDVENSLSLGSKSRSLSLSSKVDLLCDLKFIPKDLIWQFQTFAEIRNKFAHLLYVDSFEKCFEILKNRKSKFLKTFGDNIPESASEEIKLSICFTVLCFKLGIWLKLILQKASFNKDQDLKKTYVIESLRIFFSQQNNDDTLDDYLKYADTLIQEIELDTDFIKSIEHARNAKVTQ